MGDLQEINYRDTMPEGIEEWHHTRVENLYHEVPDGAFILDVGANSGEVLRLFQERKRCKGKGIDPSTEVVAKAQQKGLDVIVGEAEQLPFDDNTFDVVLMLETLNFVKDPYKALAEAKRVLKPDGVLLGSVPHKNLERYLWDEKTAHHPYWDVKELGDLLDTEFKYSHLWPLKGIQFNIQFVNTFLQNEPVEILFKCGSAGDHKWWSLMSKKDVLRVWFGPTQYEGDVYYRMRGFADKLRDKEVEAAYENFDYKNTDAQSQWQNRCRNGIVLGQLDAILKVADVSVWQMVANADALAMLRCWSDIWQCWNCSTFYDRKRGECHKCKSKGGRKRPILTDLDDWMFDVPQYNIASGPYHANSPLEWIGLRQLMVSDAIICSTSWLAAQVAGMAELKGKTTHIVPNCIDFAIWDKLKSIFQPKPASLIRIGYTGCGNHGGDLYMIRDPLKAILDEFPDVELIYAVPMKNPHDPSKDFKLDHPRATCINQWYTMQEFPQAIKNWDMDIGIAPLVDNNFNRAKSNLRWLEYGALRVPSVCSAVEPFKTTVLHNQDGLLCRSNQEWYEALKTLILSQESRERIGSNAYARVRSSFNMDAIAGQYQSLLERIKNESLSARS